MVELAKSKAKHGGHGTRLYITWKSMHYRCRHSRHYANISVCAEWKLFSAFKSWALTTGYTDNMTIERVDVLGDYDPSNCCWIPQNLQARNRKIVLRNDAGIPWCDIAKSNGVPLSRMHGRVYEGWPIELAATLPRRTRIALPAKRTPSGRFF